MEDNRPTITPSEVENNTNTLFNRSDEILTSLLEVSQHTSVSLNNKLLEILNAESSVTHDSPAMTDVEHEVSQPPNTLMERQPLNLTSIEASSVTSDDDIGPTIHFHKTNTTTPLIIKAEIINSLDRTFSCLVDNGAEINLIRADIIGELNNITLNPSNIKTITGLGHTKIKIYNYIRIQLKFDTGYISPVSDFYIVPQEHLDTELIVGVPWLKTSQLLPDMNTYQLFFRDGNAVIPVTDSQVEQDEGPTAVAAHNMEIGPNQYRIMKVDIQEVTPSNQIYLLEGITNKNTETLSGLMVNEREILVANYNEHPWFIPKGFKLGTLIPVRLEPEGSVDEETPVEKKSQPETQRENQEELLEINQSAQIRHTNIDNTEDYWNETTIEENFQINDIPVTQQQKRKLINLLLKYPNILSTGDDDVGVSTNVKHHIELETNKPVYVPVRRFQGPIAREIEEQCRELETCGIIRKSNSPYSAPVVPVRKPDGTLRLCIDYRALNKVTKSDAFPIPNLIDSVYNMSGAKYFTTIDLVRGYYQIEMAQESIEKTAFSTPLSHYEFLRMPFGVKGGPATFQRGMMLALSEIPWSEVMAYLDDIIIRSTTFDEHLISLEKVFNALQYNGFKLKPKKTKLCREIVDFLGHRVSRHGIEPLDKNLSGIKNFPVPTTGKQLQQFLGMVNFYRRHIPHCSSVAHPLSRQAHLDKITWDERCQESFDKLKLSLISPPILAFPNHNLNAPPLELYVDASNAGVGAVLQQKQDGIERPIAFVSKTFTSAQKNYSTTEKELAALRWAVKTLKPFLCNDKEFIIHSDHQPLQYLYNMALTDTRIARTLDELKEFNFVVKYISGRKNILADALSRSPIDGDIESDPIDEIPINKPNTHPSIPQGFSQREIPGGGDSLFQCLSLWMHNDDDHATQIREQVVDKLMRNPSLYQLKGRKLNKRLHALRYPGQIPIPEMIEAFTHLVDCQVIVYCNPGLPMTYGEDKEKKCYLNCISGIHYNLLTKEENVKVKTILRIRVDQVNIVKVNYGDLDDIQMISLDIPQEEYDIIDQVQEDDRLLRRLYKAILFDILKENLHKDLKIFKPNYNKIVLIENILIYVGHEKYKYVVSRPFLISTSTKLHVEWGHIGILKLLNLLEDLWHPQLKRIATDICRCCPKCQLNKPITNVPKPPLLKITAAYPFDLLAVDLLQLPKTNRNHSYVLVAIDHFSKFVVAVPLMNKTGATVANAFKNKLLPFLPRIPNRLLSDRGLEFSGNQFEDILQEFGIHHILIPALMPQCNGITERVNRTLLQLLRLMTQEHPSSWDQHLTHAITSYNNTYHSAIDATPSDMLLTRSHSFVNNPILQKYWREPSTKFSPYQKGSLVAYKTQLPGDLVINKFKPRYKGPYQIIETQPNQLTYLITREDLNGKHLQVHYSQLRPWISVPRYLRRNRDFMELILDENIQLEEEIEEDNEEIIIEENTWEEPPIQQEEEKEEDTSFDFEGFPETETSLSLNEYMRFINLTHGNINSNLNNNNIEICNTNLEGEEDIRNTLINNIPFSFSAIPSNTSVPTPPLTNTIVIVKEYSDKSCQTCNVQQTFQNKSSQTDQQTEVSDTINGMRSLFNGLEDITQDNKSSFSGFEDDVKEERIKSLISKDSKSFYNLTNINEGDNSGSSLSNAPDMEAFFQDSYIIEPSIPYSCSVNKLPSNTVTNTVFLTIPPLNIPATEANNLPNISILRDFGHYNTRSKGKVPGEQPWVMTEILEYGKQKCKKDVFLS